MGPKKGITTNVVTEEQSSLRKSTRNVNADKSKKKEEKPKKPEEKPKKPEEKKPEEKKPEEKKPEVKAPEVTPTPKEDIKPNVKALKNLKKKERGGKRRETYSMYIYKVLKQVHNDVGISKKSMDIMNSFIQDMFERVSLEASKLVRYNKKHTLSAREIQSAVKLILPGELAKHAIIEGAKAVNKIANKA